ncbi:MAG: sigma-70 family RNA polymerase sigma factor [Cyclobacteriaceae bacterium]
MFKGSEVLKGGGWIKSSETLTFKTLTLSKLQLISNLNTFQLSNLQTFKPYVTLNTNLASNAAVNELITDEELVAQVKNGDTEAFRVLIERHKNYAFTIARRIVVSAEEAEEVIQDAFMKIYKAADSFKGDSKFTTWFYRVVFNTAISSQRKNRLPTSPIDEMPLNKGGSDRQDEMRSDNRRQFIDQAMQNLSDDDKLLLTLFYFDELSLEEIAQIVDQEKSNLKVKLFRARKKLSLELTHILKDEATALL